MGFIKSLDYQINIKPLDKSTIFFIESNKVEVKSALIKQGQRHTLDFVL